MKKLFAVILAMVLCFSLCACGGDGGSTESVEDKIREAVKAQINEEVMSQQDIKGDPSITTYLDQVDEYKYEVTGKVTVLDKNGDTYTADYDAVAEYDPATDDCDVDCEMDRLKKN